MSFSLPLQAQITENVLPDAQSAKSMCEEQWAGFPSAEHLPLWRIELTLDDILTVLHGLLLALLQQIALFPS